MSKGVENKYLGDGPCINSEYDENAENHLHSWQDPKTFLVALEKVEAWIFSRIVESVWWQVKPQPFICPLFFLLIILLLLSPLIKLSFETECRCAFC